MQENSNKTSISSKKNVSATTGHSKLKSSASLANGNSFKSFWKKTIAPFKKQDSESVEFMNSVDAAEHSYGSRWTYIFSALLLFSFVLFIFWSLVSQRDEITRGTGQVIPSQGIQPVQSEDGGIIKEILVKENDYVEKDTLLAVISNIRAVGEFEELSRKKTEYDLALLRLRAEQNNEPLQYTDQQILTAPQAVEDQTGIYITRKEKFESEGRQLAATLEQRKLELTEAHKRREFLEKSLLLLKQQEEIILPLVKNKTYSQVEYLNLKQRIVSLEGDLNSLAVNISRTKSIVQEAEEALKNRVPEWQAEIARDINKYRQELNSITERLTAGTEAVQRSEVRSTMRGTIKRILLNEESVVRPAELIMEIVPTDAALEIEAKFKPESRGFLEVGQKAMVEISAYDATIYGTMDATVYSISPDTIEDAHGVPWYFVRLRTESTQLPYAEKDLEIKIGMTVYVDVISGKKSVFSYLIKPLFKSQQQGSAIGRPSNFIEEAKEPNGQ